MSSALENFLRGLFDRPNAAPGVSFSAQLGSGYDALEEEDRKRAEICAFVRRHIGKPYRLGAEVAPGQEESAKDWDCSELVEAAYRVQGVPIPDGSPYQYEETVPIPPGDPLPADLGFLWSDTWKRIGHVMVYVGGGFVIHAVGGKVGHVVEDPIAKWVDNPRWRGWRRHRAFLNSRTS